MLRVLQVPPDIATGFVVPPLQADHTAHATAHVSQVTNAPRSAPHNPPQVPLHGHLAWYRHCSASPAASSGGGCPLTQVTLCSWAPLVSSAGWLWPWATWTTQAAMSLPTT